MYLKKMPYRKMHTLRKESPSYFLFFALFFLFLPKCTFTVPRVNGHMNRTWNGSNFHQMGFAGDCCQNKMMPWLQQPFWKRQLCSAAGIMTKVGAFFSLPTSPPLTTLHTPLPPHTDTYTPTIPPPWTILGEGRRKGLQSIPITRGYTQACWFRHSSQTIVLECYFYLFLHL